MEISSTEIAILLFGALMGLVGWLYGRRQKKPVDIIDHSSVTPLTRSLATSKTGADRTSALIRACWGDRKQAERLIQLERERQAGISRTESVSRALERLMDDRAH